MRRLRFSGRLGPFDAAQSRLAPAAKARKCQKNHQALDAGGARDAKMGSEMGLERFHAQTKWEIPDQTSQNQNHGQEVLVPTATTPNRSLKTAQFEYVGL